MSELVVVPAEVEQEPEVDTEQESGPTIPLDSRISYADDYLLEFGRLSAGALAANLGTNDQWVYRMVRELGISSDEDFPDADGYATYPPYTLGVLDHELQWRRRYGDIPAKIDDRVIADILGISHEEVQLGLEQMNAKVFRSKDKRKKRPHYAKSVLNKLRPMAMELPLNVDGYSLKDLAVQTGMSVKWIDEKLASGGYEYVSRRSPETKRIGLFYPAEVLTYLQQCKAERPVPAGDWMTDVSIAQRIGRSLTWVKARLPSYADGCEIRLNDYEHEQMHYPPHVCVALQRESDWLESLPEAGDYLTIDTIAQWMGESVEDTEGYLDEYNIDLEMYKDQLGRLVEGYPADTINRIKAIERKTIRINVDAQNIVGSLRAKIYMRKRMIGILDAQGEKKSNEQRKMLVREMRRLETVRDDLIRLYDLDNDSVETDDEEEAVA